MRPAPAPYQRIATEEAFAPPEMLDIYRRILEATRVPIRAFDSLMGFYMAAPARARSTSCAA